MREVTVTKWETRAGTLCDTPDEASVMEAREEMETIIENLELYWRDVSIPELAKALALRGYKLVPI